jgi:rhodanese-related sulfurtransferase
MLSSFAPKAVQRRLAEQLAEEGFDNIYALAGGMKAWSG